MAIAFDTSVDGSFGNPVTSLSWSHAFSGTNRVAIVTAFGDLGSSDATGNNVTGCLIDGVAATEIARKLNVGDRWLYVFGQIDPLPGNRSVVITAGSSIAIAGLSASYTGVRQSELPEVSTTANSTLTSVVTSLTTVARDAWTVLADKNTNNPPTVGAGSTARKISPFSLGLFDSNGPLTPGSNSMTINVDPASNTATIMISMAPAVIFPSLGIGRTQRQRAGWSVSSPGGFF